MFQLSIQATAKGYAAKDHWRHIADTEYVCFSTFEEVKQYLRTRYAKSKRVPMYVDQKDGQTQQVGWVFGFRAVDFSHAPIERWIQQDWVHVYEIKDVPVQRMRREAV
jgi:hypothetical protein